MIDNYMDSSEKIKQLLAYLNKNYYVDDLFFSKYGDIHEWGCDITKELGTIFAFDEEICEHTFRHWAYLNGLSTDALTKAWKNYGLKAVWT